MGDGKLNWFKTLKDHAPLTIMVAGIIIFFGYLIIYVPPLEEMPAGQIVLLRGRVDDLEKVADLHQQTLYIILEALGKGGGPNKMRYRIAFAVAGSEYTPGASEHPATREEVMALTFMLTHFAELVSDRATELRNAQRITDLEGQVGELRKRVDWLAERVKGSVDKTEE